MDFRAQLRSAEKEVSLLQKQINHARRELADAERRLRRKMRIYPDQWASCGVPGAEDRELLDADLRLPVGGRAAEGLHDPETDTTRRVIVSIHGRDVIDDVDDEECGHLIQSR